MSETRAEKFARARAGIAAGEHMKGSGGGGGDWAMRIQPYGVVTASREQQRIMAVLGDEQRRPTQSEVAFDLYQCAMRSDVPIGKVLGANTKTLGSAEWSRRLREKVAASKRAEKHQVLCDIQDIE